MGLERINAIRKAKGLSLDELSKKSGVPKGTLSKITAGITKNPNLDTVQAIARALDCKLDDFDDNNKNTEEYNSIPQIIAASGGGLTNVDERMRELISDKQELCNAIYAANLDKRQIKELLGIVKTFEKI